MTPALTRRCLHGGRKPAKPLVDNLLTAPRPFRDDKSPPISGSAAVAVFTSHVAAVVAAVREFEGDEGLVFHEVASRCL